MNIKNVGCRFFVLAVAGLWPVLGGVAGAGTLYDSGGFESFSAGSVVGQDGWTSFASGVGGNSTATVQSASVESGSQALAVFRDGADDAGSTGFYRPLSANHLPVVTIRWDMYVPVAADQDPDPDFESFGPGFSMEAYVTGTKRVASIGVDAADGAFYQLQDNDPVLPIFTSNVAIQLDAWQRWELVLDFSNEVYYLAVDGLSVFVGSSVFLEDIDYAGGDRLTDASIVPFATDTFYFDIAGEAYIDNYAIMDGTAIPEPSMAAVVLCLMGAGCACRRTWWLA